MIKMDCLGEICPVPVMKLQGVADSIRRGEEYMVVTDHNCTVSNLEAFCRARNFAYKTEEVINGVWEITVSANR
ncbi:sulfurtransferase TusA family protein [Lachnospiraceae bacterium 54-53]